MSTKKFIKLNREKHKKRTWTQRAHIGGKIKINKSKKQEKKD